VSASALALTAAILSAQLNCRLSDARPASLPPLRPLSWIRAPNNSSSPLLPSHITVLSSFIFSCLSAFYVFVLLIVAVLVCLSRAFFHVLALAVHRSLRRRHIHRAAIRQG
jgi:hypothetical protein